MAYTYTILEVNMSRTGNDVPWSQAEMSLLTKLYPQAKIIRELLPKFPGRSINQLRCKARHLQLRRLPIGRQEPLTLAVCDAAYLAGLIDCDGSVSIRTTNNPQRKLSLQLHAYIGVYNTDVTLMDWLMDKVGGNHSKCRRRSLNNNHKEIYHWVSRSVVDAARILRTVLPYLVIKKRQAALVLEFCEGRVLYSSYTDREVELKDLVQALNKRGT